MILERLGIITDEVSDDLDEALEWAHTHHLSHVELRTIKGRNITDFSDDQVEDVINALRKWNMRVSCIASPVFKCPLDGNRAVLKGDTFGAADESVEEHYGKLARSIELAKRFHCASIRIFSFWREEQPEIHFEEIARHLRHAAEMASESGIVLLLENEPTCNGGFAAEVATLVRAVDAANVRALWDPGNEAYGGREAFPGGFDAVKDLLAHVHLKDVIYDDHHQSLCVPVGQGIVPYVEQMRALQQQGYTGLFTIETHYVPEGGKPRDGSELTYKGIVVVDRQLG